MQIYQQVNTEEFWAKSAELLNLEFANYDDYMLKFDHSINPESFGKRAHVWFSYNNLGLLLLDGQLEVDKVWRLAGIMSVLQWEKWRDIILEMREKQNLPTYFSGFEYLYNELLKYREEHPELAT